MTSERDIDAIATWERAERAEQPPDPGRSNGKPERRVCLDCDWRGKGVIAEHRHWQATRHRIVHHSDPRARAVDPWLVNQHKGDI